MTETPHYEDSDTISAGWATKTLPRNAPDRVTKWVHPIAQADFDQLLSAWRADQQARRMPSGLLAPMLYREFNESARRVAAGVGFRPDIPGQWRTETSTDWAEPARLYWTAD